jgi:hypothetical protein
MQRCTASQRVYDGHHAHSVYEAIPGYCLLWIVPYKSSLSPMSRISLGEAWGAMKCNDKNIGPFTPAHFDELLLAQEAVRQNHMDTPAKGPSRILDEGVMLPGGAFGTSALATTKSPSIRGTGRPCRAFVTRLCVRRDRDA